MPRTPKTDTEVQAKEPSPQPEAQTQTNETDIAHTIAQRYYGCICALAPQIAREFWNQLDTAVAVEILKQRPGKNPNKTPHFLSGIGEHLAQLEYSDATTRALASGGGMG
jgi:hypothetical protein